MLNSVRRALKPAACSEPKGVFCYSKFIINIERVACPNYTKFGTALPWDPSCTPTKCEVDEMNGSRDMRRTNTHCFLVRCVHVCACSLELNYPTEWQMHNAGTPCDTNTAQADDFVNQWVNQYVTHETETRCKLLKRVLTEKLEEKWLIYAFMFLCVSATDAHKLSITGPSHYGWLCETKSIFTLPLHVGSAGRTKFADPYSTWCCLLTQFQWFTALNICLW